MQLWSFKFDLVLVGTVQDLYDVGGHLLRTLQVSLCKHSSNFTFSCFMLNGVILSYIFDPKRMADNLCTIVIYKSVFFWWVYIYLSVFLYVLQRRVWCIYYLYLNSCDFIFVSFCLSIHEVSDISSVFHNDMFNIYLTVSLRTRGNVRRVGGKNLGGG